MFLATNFLWNWKPWIFLRITEGLSVWMIWMLDLTGTHWFIASIQHIRFRESWWNFLICWNILECLLIMKQVQSNNSWRESSIFLVNSGCLCVCVIFVSLFICLFVNFVFFIVCLFQTFSLKKWMSYAHYSDIWFCFVLFVWFCM